MVPGGSANRSVHTTVGCKQDTRKQILRRMAEGAVDENHQAAGQEAIDPELLRKLMMLQAEEEEEEEEDDDDFLRQYREQRLKEMKVSST
jgi:hypothetical protein